MRLNWQQFFKFPNNYLENVISDEEIESRFRYEMPEELLLLFTNSENLYIVVCVNLQLKRLHYLLME